MMTASTGQQYAVLTESCEWEGETWRFYIPIKGNEDALNALVKAIVSLNSRFPSDDEPFVLDLTPISEGEVDTLVKHGGDTTYMEANNKLEGYLAVPEESLAKLASGDLDPLHKGRVADYMRATKP